MLNTHFSVLENELYSGGANLCFTSVPSSLPGFRDDRSPGLALDFSDRDMKGTRLNAHFKDGEILSGVQVYVLFEEKQ